MPWPRGFFATARGAVLCHEEIGTGPAVLALPGIGGGAFFFDGLAQHLQKRCRLISLDLPGTGRSASAPSGFSLESWMLDLEEFVSGHVREPVVILGHSLGTILALHAAANWPQWVRGLVFVGGLPRVRPEIRVKLAARAVAVEQEGLRGWGPRVSPGIFSPVTPRSQPAMVEEFERRFESQDAGAYVRSIEILLGADASALATSVRVPCMAITGRDDAYAPPEAVIEFARGIRGCPVRVLERCGHMPFLEAPERFADLVASFLDGIETPRALSL